jgi:hypothetical protein
MTRISFCEKSYHDTEMKWEGCWLISAGSVALFAAKHSRCRRQTENQKFILLITPLPLSIKMFMTRISFCEKSHHGTIIKREGSWLISPLADILTAFPASSVTNGVTALIRLNKQEGFHAHCLTVNGKVSRMTMKNNDGGYF